MLADSLLDKLYVVVLVRVGQRWEYLPRYYYFSTAGKGTTLMYLPLKFPRGYGVPQKSRNRTEACYLEDVIVELVYYNVIIQRVR